MLNLQVWELREVLAGVVLVQNFFHLQRCVIPKFINNVHILALILSNFFLKALKDFCSFRIRLIWDSIFNGGCLVDKGEHFLMTHWSTKLNSLRCSGFDAAAHVKIPALLSRTILFLLRKSCPCIGMLVFVVMIRWLIFFVL